MRTLLKIIFGISALFVTGVVYAYGGHQDVGAMACGLRSQVPEIALLPGVIAMLIGIIFVGAGIMRLKDSAQGGQSGPNDKPGVAIAFIVIGGLLTSIVAISLLSSNTLFDTKSTLSSPVTGSGTPLGSFTKDACK